MKLGDILRHRKTGVYGVLQYSFAGGKVYFYDEVNNAVGKSVGQSLPMIMANWEVCDMPEGYQWDESGLFIRKATY